MWNVEPIKVTRLKSLRHTDEGIAKNWRSKQSRQDEECGYKVEAGPGKYSRCSKKKGEVEVFLKES